jgi:hypothetical protein
MTQTITGYHQDNTGAWISKDPTAQLAYSMDWSAWLPTSDAIQTVSHTLQVRSNDPQPLTRISEGTAQTGTQTYVELAGGQVGKIYTITAYIVTQNGLKDSRSFRVKVENRSA